MLAVKSFVSLMVKQKLKMSKINKMQKVAMSTYAPILSANFFHAIAAEDHAEYF